MSGYLDYLATKIQFWTKKLSNGKPSKAHSPIIAASKKYDVSFKNSETWISFEFKSVWKYSLRSFDLNSELNRPQYETKAHSFAHLQ